MTMGALSYLSGLLGRKHHSFGGGAFVCCAFFTT